MTPIALVFPIRNHDLVMLMPTTMDFTLLMALLFTVAGDAGHIDGCGFNGSYSSNTILTVLTMT